MAFLAAARAKDPFGKKIQRTVQLGGSNMMPGDPRGGTRRGQGLAGARCAGPAPGSGLLAGARMSGLMAGEGRAGAGTGKDGPGKEAGRCTMEPLRGWMAAGGCTVKPLRGGRLAGRCNTSPSFSKRLYNGAGNININGRGR